MCHLNLSNSTERTPLMKFDENAKALEVIAPQLKDWALTGFADGGVLTLASEEFDDEKFSVKFYSSSKDDDSDDSISSYVTVPIGGFDGSFSLKGASRHTDENITAGVQVLMTLREIDDNEEADVITASFDVLDEFAIFTAVLCFDDVYYTFSSTYYAYEGDMTKPFKTMLNGGWDDLSYMSDDEYLVHEARVERVVRTLMDALPVFS